MNARADFEAGFSVGAANEPWASVPSTAAVSAADCFEQAAARTHSPSEQIAYRLDAWLVTHPEACATAADYPGWVEQFAAIKAAHTNTTEAS